MHRSEALVYNSDFFQNRRFTETQYSTLDSHTNSVISHAVAYSSRWLPKPWQSLLHFTIRHLRKEQENWDELAFASKTKAWFGRRTFHVEPD